MFSVKICKENGTKSHYWKVLSRFHVAVRLFSNNRSQMTSKCGENRKVAHEAQSSVSLMFLPHFDVLCDLLKSFINDDGDGKKNVT